MTSSCQIHDQSWHLLSQKGGSLCAKCCQNTLESSLEDDVKRKDVLSQLGAHFRLTPKLATNLSDSQRMSSEESHSLVVCINSLIYHSDSQMRHLAKNCLSLMSIQMKEQKVIEYIFEDIVKKISIDTNFWNESVLDLMANLIPEVSMSEHYLRDDINFLFKTFHFEFNRLNDRLKTSLLRIFNEFYLNLKSNELFALDIDFHQKTLLMVFNAFESFTANSNDKQLVVNSIDLMKNLSQIDSILKPLTTDQNIIKYMNKLLNDKCVEIKCNLLEWICDLLDNESIQRCFASTLEKEMMSTFGEQLYSSNNASFSKPLVVCLCLIFEKSRKMMSEMQLQSLLKSVIKSLNLSVNCKDNTLFKISLTLLIQIIKRKPNNQFLNEFDFYSILDLLELSLTVSDLFREIVEFCALFLDFKIIPILIPTQRMTKIIKKVLDNIHNTNSDENSGQQYIIRAVSVVKLIKSCLNLINEKKNKEFTLEETQDVHFLNVEKRWNCDDIDLEEVDGKQDNDSVNLAKNTEVYEFLSFCLEKLEDFFIKSLEELSSELYFEDNSQLFQEICLCFDIIIKNDLFVTEDINRFVKRMFSKGYVLSVVQLLWSYVYPLSSESFICQICSFLSHFVFKIQEIEGMDENQFEPKLIQKAFNHFKEKSVDHSESDNELTENLSEDTYKQFVDIFFAINYFCQKSFSEDILDMNFDYMQQFLTVLNHFLENGLNTYDSCLTIKYSLFLSSLSYLNESSVNALQQFFDKRDDKFYSKYYTNHIKLLKWIFNHLKCEPFCEFALKMFFKAIPDSGLDLEEKHKILLFFELFDSNERAVQILIKTLCDTKEDDPTIDVILMILEDSDLFIDEYDIHYIWNTFCDKFCSQIPLIVDQIIAKIQKTISDGMAWNVSTHRSDSNDLMDDPMVGRFDNEDIEIVNPESLTKIIKLLTFLSRLLSNERNVVHFEASAFETLLQSLCQLIDLFLDESSVHNIFKFFRLCVNSCDNQEIEKSLTLNLLDSQIGTQLLFTFVDNNLWNDSNKETALFLLSFLSKNKDKYELKHQFVFEFEINRLMYSLNSESKAEAENAFVLLCNSFDANTYFESQQKSERIKCEEMRKLLHCLQNAIFRKYITLKQFSRFLKTFFNDLKKDNSLIMKDLANSPWFQVIVDNYLQSDEKQVEDITEEDNNIEDNEDRVVPDPLQRDLNPTQKGLSSAPKMSEEMKEERLIQRILREEFIDFLLVFFELDFVNISLIEVMNKMTEHYINVILNEYEKLAIDDSIKDKIFKCLQTIDCGKYRKHLTKDNKNHLKNLSKSKSKVSPELQTTCRKDHSYSYSTIDSNN